MPSMKARKRVNKAMRERLACRGRDPYQGTNPKEQLKVNRWLMAVLGRQTAQAQASGDTR